MPIIIKNKTSSDSGLFSTPYQKTSTIGPSDRLHSKSTDYREQEIESRKI